MISALRNTALVTTIAMLALATPAAARSSRCIAPPFVSCVTDQVPGNSAHHFVYMQVHTSFTNYDLLDTGTQVHVRHGTTGGGWHYETIFGLVGWYQLTCSSGFGSTCTLSNT